MHGSLFVGRVAGFRIGFHYTWLIALALFTWLLAGDAFPSQYPGWSPATYWITGLVAALALFLSVLIHELAHSVVARSRGIDVEDITLYIFGGVSRIKAEATTPRDEFLIAVVGPLSSLALAGVSWVASLIAGRDSGPIYGVLYYTATANLILALFNLIPGFPLDGGRVLRAIIWGISGSMDRSTRIASVVGQVTGFAFIAIGIIQTLSPGGFLSGLWTIFIGWFINSGAESSRRQSETQNVFRTVRVSDLMTQDPPTANPNLSVADFVHDYAVRRGLRALPVLVGDRIYGIVSVSDARKIPVEEWETTPIATILTRDELATVRPSDSAEVALRAMAERDVNQVLVTDDGRLSGVLTRSSLLQYMQLHSQLGYEPRGGRRLRSPVGPK